MFDPRGFKLANDLSFMFGCKRSRNFQFNYQSVFNEQICKILAQQCSIFIKDIDWMLLLYLEASLAQTMNERILINFLEMTMCMINANVIGDLPYLITQRFDVLHGVVYSTAGLLVLFFNRRERKERKDGKLRITDRSFSALFAFSAVHFTKYHIF